MEYVKIISDSTCDLSGELIDRYDISILPLHVLLGEKEYKDGVDITPEDIYRWSDENNTTPKTSAPSMEEAMELMRPFVEARAERLSASVFQILCPAPAMPCVWRHRNWRQSIW